MPSEPGPAFYARRGGRLADWWTVLHPPYTLWHLGYVVLGAAMAPDRDWGALGLSLLAFLLAVGVAAHALDELTGRPLRTGIGDRTLQLAAALGVLGAIGLGLVGIFWWGPVNWPLLAAVPVGVLLVVGYNLELFGGRLHNDASFALGGGGFPVVVGYLAQFPPYGGRDVVAAVLATGAGIATSYVQRRLSTAARALRRRTTAVSPLERDVLLEPLEGALKALAWGVPLVAVAALLA